MGNGPHHVRRGGRHRHGVVVFTFGVLGLSRAEADRAEAGAATVGRALAGLCFLACAAVVAYGIHLIVPQFH
ncbi:hypothetical protein [Streptomyces sp. NPDC003996]